MKSTSDSRKGKVRILVLIFLWTTVGLALPVTSLAAKGDAPMTPINVQVRSPFPISSEVEAKLIAVTKDLIQKNFSEILAKSSSMEASASILEKSPTKGYVVEVLMVSLFKESYTAQMSRMEFTYKDGQASLVGVQPYFQPK